MSAFAAVVGARADDGRSLDAMVRAAVKPYDADADAERVGGAHCVVAARSTAWERALVGPAVASAYGVVVAADATLYHTDDLRRALRPHVVVAPDAGTATLLCAAVRAFGEDAAEHIEGDFAFVAHDAERGLLVAARDFMGRRALYHACTRDGVALASHPAMLLAHADVSAAPNVLHLAGRAAGLLEADDTAYAAIDVLHPGRTLVARVAPNGRVSAPTIHRHWMPPTFEAGGGPTFDEAAARLREGLERATDARLSPSGPTAVWLSGGYDSPAVFASGAAALGADRGVRMLRAVSMRYPVGDPGHEDARIAAVAAHHDVDVTWHDVNDVALFGDEAGVARRAGPFAHAFECWMGALAARGASLGARVALDGSGGDQLFQVSSVYVADLVRRGRWPEARRALRVTGLARAGWRRVARVALLPLLPPAGWRALAALRGGRPIRGLRAGAVPAWIRPSWRDALRDRLEARLVPRRGESAAALESRWYLETSYAGAVFAEQTAIVRGAGAEMRSPLYDGRIVRLAAQRPRRERAHEGETKCLLRAAMRTRLPPVVLAPRTGRSGTTDAFFRRGMARELPQLASRVVHDPALADLGVLDPDLFAAAVSRYLRADDAEAGAAIFATVQAERWLRARM